MVPNYIIYNLLGRENDIFLSKQAEKELSLIVKWGKDSQLGKPRLRAT